MIHEYAVEPALLSRWERFRYITEKFGVSEGRLISRYPKRWKAMVYGALAECTEIEKKKIEEKLRSIDDRMLTRTHHWDANNGWLENAEDEHAARPFHALISQENPRNRTSVLCVDILDDRLPLWSVDREIVVARQAHALADALAPLLTIGRQLVFIDPHFSPFKSKSRNTMQAFLEKAVLRSRSIEIERVEFQTKYMPEIRGFAEACGQLCRRIPAGLRVTITRWQERQHGEGLHNRYVLTERGGVRLAWGLDEGNPSQTDDLTLLDRNLFHTRWEQYCGPSPAFDLVESIDLEGIARMG